MAWDFPNPSTLRRVPVADEIDGLNHVNNGAYVRWCEGVGAGPLGIAWYRHVRLSTPGPGQWRFDTPSTTMCWQRLKVRI